MSIKQIAILVGAIMMPGLLIADGGHDRAADSHTNKTHFADSIGWFQSGTYMRSAFSWHDCMTLGNTECMGGSALQIVPFGGKLMHHGKKELGGWFGLNHKNTLKVSENYNTDTGLLEAGAAIDARHFNIVTSAGSEPFKSAFSLCPDQQFFGIGLDFKQALWCNDDNSARWWAEVSAPVVHVHNTMHLEENVAVAGTIASGTGLDGAAHPANMREAFNQKNWKYGKIASGDKGSNECKHEKKWGVADLELKFGYNGVLTDCASLSSYVGVLFPTGTKQKAEYVFEPIVGSKYWGLEAGAQSSFGLFVWDDAKIALNWDFNARYLFKHKAMRSFDLIGKPWSRYMEMYASLQDAVAAQTAADEFMGTSGINLMTREVHVTPRLQINNNVAVVYSGCYVSAEAGWTAYARQGEKICPNWDEGPVLKSRLGKGLLTSARTIRNPNVVQNGVGGGAATVQAIPVSGSSVSPIVYDGWTDPSKTDGTILFNPVVGQPYLETVPFNGYIKAFSSGGGGREIHNWTQGLPGRFFFDQTNDDKTGGFSGFPGDALVTGDYLQSIGCPVQGDVLRLTTAGITGFGDLAPTKENYNQVKITEDDIDWASGAHDAVLANTLYGTIGINWDDASWPMVFAVGGAYDCAFGNAAMTRWTVFGKLGVSF